MMPFENTSKEQLEKVLQEASSAFQLYKSYTLQQRADFMRAIAKEMEALGDVLLETAAAETNLPLARLTGERARTIFQLNSYAAAAEQGSWLEASIDTADAERTPPKPDTRKMLVPLGPVVVFGASNFPFAYSTAGGDTAGAFAAGCPVIVKAHPAHVQTSTMVASAIHKAAEKCGMPKGIFSHVYGNSNEAGEYLVKHEAVKAVGFTGSFSGGKALFDWANQRAVPIPVFAEMSSVNPVFLLPNKLELETENLAQQLASSITLGVGQFCTNPGLIIGLEGEALHQFAVRLGKEISGMQPATMLHKGIVSNYVTKRAQALAQKGVSLVNNSTALAGDSQAEISIATCSAATFLSNSLLREEVFGPYSLIISCKDENELISVIQQLGGQLTATLMATPTDLRNHPEVVSQVQDLCGRYIINTVPTGVEVALSMQHGGPFPSTTDSRFTSVGADGIKRFARPLCYQNWPDEFLPAELKNENPLGIWRTVNNELSREAL